MKFSEDFQSIDGGRVRAFRAADGVEGRTHRFGTGSSILAALTGLTLANKLPLIREGFRAAEKRGEHGGEQAP